ncbi:MAG: ABC transporter ATP-binding protein [Planctomycetaceae bacterium]|nr:ABC transporter ATP-binding protein [Planctomycetaceae bacterium]
MEDKRAADTAPSGRCSTRRAARELMQLSWKNSWRAIRLGFRYPVRLIASIGLACLAAACWGGNIAAVWPVLQVTLEGQSMHEWSESRIAASEQKINELTERIGAIHNGVQLPLPPGELPKDLSTLQNELKSERNALDITRKLHPYILRYMPVDPFQTVLCVMVAIVLGTIFKNLCAMGSTLLTARITLDIIRDLRQQFFDTVLRTDVESFTKKGTSQLWTRFVQDIPYLSFALTAIYGRAIGEPLKILACLAFAAYFNWRLLVLSLIVTPIALLLISALSRRMRSYTVNAYDQDASTNTLVFEVMQGLSTVQAYTMEPMEKLRFAEAAQKCWNIGQRVVMFRSLSKPAVELLGITFVCTGVVAGAHLVLHKGTHLFGLRISERPLEVAGLLIFFGFLVGAYDPLRKLGEVLPQIQMGLAAGDRLFPVLDAQPKILAPAEPQPLMTPHTELVFEDVHFRYLRSRPVLQGVDLSIPFGETIAIVGPNGCGKTTLANLLPRFFDPVQGRVLLDNTDLRDVDLVDLRRKIGLVTQQAHLFDDSVMNNIRYGNLEASDAEVVAAAEQAHAHEFITKQLVKGYDTMVGQGGCRLSGGQRQRIALARAILRNPEILIMDEPTSQIDLQSEKLIQDALEHFIIGRTAIFITHRLSLLSLAHRIVVMQGGKIVDIGQHEHLIDRCHLYRRLHQLDHQKPRQGQPPKAA